jgi:hypothetical protein
MELTDVRFHSLTKMLLDQHALRANKFETIRLLNSLAEFQREDIQGKSTAIALDLIARAYKYPGGTIYLQDHFAGRSGYSTKNMQELVVRHMDDITRAWMDGYHQSVGQEIALLWNERWTISTATLVYDGPSDFRVLLVPFAKHKLAVPG